MHSFHRVGRVVSVVLIGSVLSGCSGTKAMEQSSAGEIQTNLATAVSKTTPPDVTAPRVRITVPATDAANNVATMTVPVSRVIGLVAAYGFNEASGSTTMDASGNNNTGTLGGGVVRTASGRFGSSLSFNGDYVTVANAASLNLTTTMTLEAWVYPTGTGDYGTVVMKEQPGAYVYALYGSAPSTPSAEFNVGKGQSGQRITSSPSSLVLNTWTHLATTFDGSIVRVYVNGTQVASQAFTGRITTSSGALRIGGSRVRGEYFTGQIDEVRVYDRALSSREVQSDMTTAIGGQPHRRHHRRRPA